jgi:hypothetical protein
MKVQAAKSENSAEGRTMLTFKADVGLKLTEWLLPAYSVEKLTSSPKRARYAQHLPSTAALCKQRLLIGA